MMKYYYFGFIGLLCLLSACTRLPAQKQYFFSDHLSQQRQLCSQASKVLLISAPTGTSAFRTKEMLYMQKPYELSQYARHEWAASPADMLAPLLVGRFQHTGCFKAVISPPYAGAIDFRLDTEMVALYQVFQDSSLPGKQSVGKQSSVVLKVQAEWMDVSANRLLKSQLFSVCVPAPESSPYGGVIAANQAVNQILNQLTAWVVEQMRQSESRSHRAFLEPSSVNRDLKLSNLPIPNVRSR